MAEVVYYNNTTHEDALSSIPKSATKRIPLQLLSINSEPTERITNKVRTQRTTRSSFFGRTAKESWLRRVWRPTAIGSTIALTKFHEIPQNHFARSLASQKPKKHDSVFERK